MATLRGVILRRLLMLIAVSIVAASCSAASDSVAATVNDHDILVSDIVGLRSTYGDDLVIADTFRDDLSRVIFQEAVAQGLAAEFGVVVDPALVDTRVEEANAAIEANGITLDVALGVEGATEALLRREAEAFEMRSAGLVEVARQQDLVDLVDNQPQSITEVCVRHILVATQAEAENVAARLGEGEDFAAVATEVSLDSGTPGGDLGCSLASRFVGEFAQASISAPLGSVFGPVETEFGFHLLIVDDRTTPSLADVQSDPLSYLPEDLTQSLWTTWFNDQVRAADITIASEIGRWSPVALGIAPPDGG